MRLVGLQFFYKGFQGGWKSQPIVYRNSQDCIFC